MTPCVEHFSESLCVCVCVTLCGYVYCCVVVCECVHVMCDVVHFVVCVCV